MRAKSFLVLVLTLWATAHVFSFYWELTRFLPVPRCRRNCYVVSELAYVLLGKALVSLLLGMLPLFADLGLGLVAHSWRRFYLLVVLAVLAFKLNSCSLIGWVVASVG